MIEPAFGTIHASSVFTKNGVPQEKNTISPRIHKRKEKTIILLAKKEVIEHERIKKSLNKLQETLVRRSTPVAKQ